jgi:PhnB protein
MSIQAYIFFDGVCEQALEFYKGAVGAEVQTLLRHKDAPVPPAPGMVAAGCENKIMHASFKVGDTLINASDGRCGGHPEFKGFSLSLNTSGPTEAERAFAALAAGGTVDMPLGKTFWSPLFGMLTDKFGIHWMISIPL